MTQQTFSIIKPDATRRNLTGAINQRFEENGLRIVAQKRIRIVNFWLSPCCVAISYTLLMMLL